MYKSWRLAVKRLRDEYLLTITMIIYKLSVIYLNYIYTSCNYIYSSLYCICVFLSNFFMELLA